MIQAVIFDLDGTLVKTERLKALSYASAMFDLCNGKIPESDVIEAFKDFVGLSRREVASSLLEKFEALSAASQRMEEYGVNTPWQAYVQMRMRYYEEMVSDPHVIKNNQWSHNVDLLQAARQANCQTGLATMSRCPQTQRILEILNLRSAFDFIATLDDVKNGKPDPEIYHLVAAELDVHPKSCLVIEDSPSGVNAALSAGMKCIAVSTPFTQRALHQQGLLEDKWIVDEPSLLVSVFGQLFNEFYEGSSKQTIVNTKEKSWL